MRLSELLDALPAELAPRARLGESVDPVIRGIGYDSRTVAPGDLFVALRGAVADGHEYLEDAVRLGAAAMLVEALPEGNLSGAQGACPAIEVADTRRAMAPIATRFFGEPARECSLVGITGTNGKTSTSYLVESIVQATGTRTGLIGTVEIRYGDERERAVNTTPESLDLQRLLRTMLNRHTETIVMEVSSHGLELGRVAGCAFRVAAFTNLTQDHLDFHGDMRAYLASKARLFREHLAPGATAVINVDDPAGAEMCAIARDAGAQLVRCSRDAKADAEVRLTSADCRIDGSTIQLAMPSAEYEIESPLVGDFNVENLLVACGIAEALGVYPEDIVTGVRECPQVPGRIERIGDDASRPTVLVDYAHTPDAVEKLLQAVRPLASGRVITVFGCGGDRDPKKRPLMAEAAAANSDLVIATSDNPRTEAPEAILDDVERGLGALRRVPLGDLGVQDRCYATAVDRRDAIAQAILIASPRTRS